MTAKHLAFVFSGLALLGSCSAPQPPPSNIDVTNGKPESGFPYVVSISLDGRGMCTGSFVSDSLLITAAHCVDRVSRVSYKGASAGRDDIFVNPGWPMTAEACQANPRNPKYDLALVRFPDGTYMGGEYAKLLGRTPDIGEEFTIVGFGNNVITPFEKFCTMQGKADSDGQCHVRAGTMSGTSVYSYKKALSFDPVPDDDSVGCPVECNTKALKAAILAQGMTISGFVNEHCGGNFRDRSYQEAGAGSKRSGKNVVKEVNNGLIGFDGHTGSNNSGIDSASGAGDSGGPMFIEVQGEQRLAATTHGGFLSPTNGSLRKKSYYVNVASEHNLPWIRQIVNEEQLMFPELDNISE